MNVTDSPRASAAATLVLGALGANVGLTLLTYVVTWLVPGSYEGPFPLVLEVLWLGAVSVLAVGLFQLSAVVDEPMLLRVTAGVMLFNALVDVLVTAVWPRLGASFGEANRLMYDASMVLSLGARGLLMFSLVRLAMRTYAWVIPLLATVALLTVMRSAFSMASMHNLVPTELYRNAAYRFALPLMSFFNVSAMLVAGFAVKTAVATGAQTTPELVAAAGLRPAEAVPESPVSDFIVGGILLSVGVGVTVVTLAAASDGGRYVVATGAIGVGLARLIRGFVRLGRR